LEDSIWDIEGRKIKNFFTGHELAVNSLDFSRDGTRLASGSWDGTARLWNMETGLGLLRLSIEAGVMTVAIRSDGKCMAVGGWDNIVRIWDIEKGTMVERLMGHTGGVYSVAFCPNGRELFSGSLDNTIKRWEVNRMAAPCAGVCNATFVGHKDSVTTLALSADGKWVVSGSDDRRVLFWNTTDRHPHFMVESHRSRGYQQRLCFGRWAFVDSPR